MDFVVRFISSSYPKIKENIFYSIERREYVEEIRSVVEPVVGEAFSL